jgi:demethylmenaquinone methyltransferase/2-methoxy-6-polyprenyl-1,4-benzoquinol methylase
LDRLAWYRRIAPSYDLICRPLYGGARRSAVGALELQPGHRVLDIGCGTGLALPQLAAAVGSEGKVVGLDGSAPMLRRARRRTAAYPQVRCVEQDLRDSNWTAAVLDETPYDALFFGLSLAVIENWQQVFEQAWQLLAPGGRCAIYDTRPLQRGWRILNPLFVPVVGWTGAADLRRPTWNLLDGCAEQIHREARYGGFVFVRAGTRPIG